MDLDEFYKQLDEEGKQEEAVTDQSSAFAELVPETFRVREREYKDPQKQWIRESVWLETAKEIAEKIQRMRPDSGGLRYLTLPGYYRLDVSLLHSEGLIEVTKENRDGSAREVYIVGFESDKWKFGRMSDQQPTLVLLGLSSLEDALLDHNNKYYQQLAKLFPFDLINLDLTTSLTPKHEGPYSRTMQAIETVFERQATVPYWGLFLTFRNVPDEWEDRAREQLYDNLQDNIHQHVAVREKFVERYGDYRVSKLHSNAPLCCTSQAVAKWIVDRAHHHKFCLDQMRCYSYPRYNLGTDRYSIYKHVFCFSRAQINSATIPTKGIPEQSWMIEDLLKCVSQHKCYDVEEILLRKAEHVPVFEALEQNIESLIATVD